MKLTLEIEREVDGRWIADVTDLPGVMAYGKTRARAVAAVEALALRVIADRIENGEHVLADQLQIERYQSAIAAPISCGESSWMKCMPLTVTSC